MEKGAIAPNLQSYAGYLECIARSNFWDVSEIRKVIHEMKRKVSKNVSYLWYIQYLFDDFQFENIVILICRVFAIKTFCRNVFSKGIKKKK